MTFEYAADIQALYVRFRRGKVAETVEIEHFVVVDLDGDGEPLGIEFVAADDFLPFLGRHGGRLTLPDDLVALTSAVVQASAGTTDATAQRRPRFDRIPMLE